MRKLLFVIPFFLFSFSYAQQSKGIITNKTEPDDFVSYEVINDTLNCDSIIQVFYKNGQLFYRSFYKNGFKTGWYEQFHQNGAIWCKFLYNEGKIIDGLNICYSENGQISQKGFFKNGNEIGKWYSYTEDGSLFKVYKYNKWGKLISVKIWDDEKKKWIRQGFM
jgi:antitoxin component YwqK of YwqJK toxin-antitoxin module